MDCRVFGRGVRGAARLGRRRERRGRRRVPRVQYPAAGQARHRVGSLAFPADGYVQPVRGRAVEAGTQGGRRC